eukprot:scaffold70604_cov65-Phaeocystis_antarctica.AAC.1
MGWLVVPRVTQLHAFHWRQPGLDMGVLENTRRVGVVVVDDGGDAAVVCGHGAQVGRGQPAVGGAREPASLFQYGVEDLVVGRLCVFGPGHGLSPRREHGARALRLVEEDHAAARGGRARVLPVALIRPVVEDGHVAPAIGPAARHEEMREGLELEVRVEEDDGQLRRVELVADEARLERDRLVTEVLAALGRAGPEGVARQQRRLAADADARARAEQALRLVLVHRRVERDADEVVVLRLADAAHHHVRLARLDASHPQREAGRRVLVARLLLGRLELLGERPWVPECVVGRRLEQRGVHARSRAFRRFVEPVEVRAPALQDALGALILTLVGAAGDEGAEGASRAPRAIGQPARLLDPCLDDRCDELLRNVWQLPRPDVGDMRLDRRGDVKRLLCLEGLHVLEPRAVVRAGAVHWIASDAAGVARLQAPRVRRRMRDRVAHAATDAHANIRQICEAVVRLVEPVRVDVV